MRPTAPSRWSGCGSATPSGPWIAPAAASPGTVIALGSTPAPADHHVIRLTLADGRSVTASPGHPLADGRTLGGAPARGCRSTAAACVGLESIDYDAPETFDLVVSGETGIYLAGGIPLGSTLD